MRPLFLILFVLILATALCRSIEEANITGHMKDNSSEHMQGFPYIQECPIPQTNTTYISNDTADALSAFYYLLINLITAYVVQMEYQQEKFCFTYSLILIVWQFHIGLIQMLATVTIVSSIICKGFYFLSLLVANTLAFLRIVSLKRLKRRQKYMMVIYSATMIATGIYDFQLYLNFQWNLFIFSPIIHLYNLKQRQKAIYSETIKLEDLLVYLVNFLFFLMGLERYSQLVLKTPLTDEILRLQNFGVFMILINVALASLPDFNDIWVMFSRTFINILKVKLGMTLQEEICRMCLQKMDHFAFIYQRVAFCSHPQESDLFELECGHLFHKKCVIFWRILQRKCPIDNSPITL